MKKIKRFLNSRNGGLVTVIISIVVWLFSLFKFACGASIGFIVGSLAGPLGLLIGVLAGIIVQYLLV